jgi:mRNA interferase MazF
MNSTGSPVTASIKRGEVFLVNFDPTLGAEAKKTRPAVVVSNDINNAHSPIISISPVSSKITRTYSFEVEIPSGTGGLKTRSKIMANQTRVVDKIRLVKKMGHLSPEIMSLVDRALKLHYGL